VKTIIITEEADAGKLGKDLIYEAINFKKNVARQVCEVLHKHHIISVLVEGGSQTLKTFISEGLWDEARIFTGPALLKGGLDAPRITGKTINDLSIREDRLKILSND
jgi:diaminohydroxyphosphoribosylaminopyrimidine deaminase/5-amino-6-(5-phosphoribosylamino)uracil reductase